MSILVAERVEKSWGARHVLRGCDLRVDERDRVALVGANGCGKSTFLDILAGAEAADSGDVRTSGSTALLTQRAELTGRTVRDAVHAAVAWHGELLWAWEAALAAGDTRAAADLQDRLDARGWTVEHQVAGVLDRVGAPALDAEIAVLSGGERRRVALAVALLRQPDVLLLDEPTNHLDLDAVEWLQAWLIGYRGAVVLVTHDRYLLEAVADRIVEIDQGETVAYEGSYTDYLVERAERHARRDAQRDRLMSLIEKEAAWAARSPAARTTKQKARLQRLDALREKVPTLSERKYKFAFSSGIHKGTTLVSARGVTKSFGAKKVLDKVDLELRPGDRLGVLGPNGAGKSTLVRILMGALAPDQGTVQRLSRATIGVIDQQRSGFDPDDTVIDAIADGQRFVRRGDDDVPVQGFLGYFAFPREAFEQKVGALSGGERARLLMARLMLQGHPLLLLDEPTNDLDLLTMRVLEEALLEFDGAALIVTHDRAFLDRVCTGVLAFEGNGKVARYASRSQAVAAREAAREPKPVAPVAPVKAPVAAAAPKKSWKERKELEDLPGRIEALEAELATVEAAMADPATWRDRPGDVAGLTARHAALEGEIAAAYARWEELGG